MREHVRPSVTRAEEVVANASGENFPVALRLLPARHRRHLTNLYFFARLTDDLGDEARDTQADVSELRLRLLGELAADVDRIYAGGTPESPVMCAMADTVSLVTRHMPLMLSRAAPATPTSWCWTWYTKPSRVWPTAES